MSSTMKAIKLASGDNNNGMVSVAPEYEDEAKLPELEGINREESDENLVSDITPQAIDENELKLKDRIAQCKNIIESLKFELNEEKAKLEKETKSFPTFPATDTLTFCYDESTSDNILADISYSSNMHTAVSECIDKKLNCDESLIEYEKQLQKYQNTLNMAQIEKKNAIRKQMLTKAYKLKLLEVENQCNIELLRVKQSLQCLEPLKIIANSWKTSSEEFTLEANNIELLPKLTELNATSGSDIFKDGPDLEVHAEKSEESIINESENSIC